MLPRFNELGDLRSKDCYSEQADASSCFM
jgi:hypothetical protein